MRTVTDWPTSYENGPTGATATVGSESTTNESGRLVMVLLLESVTDTVTEKVPAVLGTQAIVGELEGVQPSGRPVHVYPL